MNDALRELSKGMKIKIALVNLGYGLAGSWVCRVYVALAI